MPSFWRNYLAPRVTALLILEEPFLTRFRLPKLQREFIAHHTHVVDDNLLGTLIMRHQIAAISIDNARITYWLKRGEENAYFRQMNDFPLQPKHLPLKSRPVYPKSRQLVAACAPADDIYFDK